MGLITRFIFNILLVWAIYLNLNGGLRLQTSTQHLADSSYTSKPSLRGYSIIFGPNQSYIFLYIYILKIYYFIICMRYFISLMHI